MPVICLGTTHVLYIRGWIQVCVKEEPYSSCNLFKLCKHTLKPPRRGCIYVFKCSTGSNGSRKIKQGEYLAISNPCLCLECVDVYYNQHDPVKKPLVLVFKFKNGDDRSNGVTNRYYRMSCFETDKGKCKTKRIDQLCRYDSDSDILCPLIEENDILANVLTYDIMRRPTGAGAGNGPCTYNCNKITVTKNGDDTSTSANGEPKLGAGFTRYKHAPTGNGSNGGNSNGDKPACMIYRCQTLMGANGTDSANGEKELPGIQGKTYKCVSVYFGCKAKRNGAGASTAGKSAGACPAPSTSGTENTACKPGATACSPATGKDTCPAAPPSATTSPCNQDVPLLLELHRNGTKGDTGANPQYYAHVRKNGAQETGGNNEGQYYWVKLPCKNGADGRTNGDCVLKNLLDDIGLHTSSSGAGDNGHETLKKLLKQALNNGATDGANGQDLTEKLQKATGQNLTKLLGQPVNGSQPSVQNGSKTLITLLLRRIEFNVTDSVVVLLDKKCKNGGHNGVASGQDGSYGDPDIESAIRTLQSNGKSRINRLKLGNGTGGVNGKPITVKCVTCSTGDQNGVCQCLAKCLTKYGYCVILHDFGTAVTGKLGQGCSAGLRLLLPTKENNERGGGGGGGGGQTKYAELRLYDDATKTDPAHLQYLYYKNGVSGGQACTTPADAQASQTCSSTTDAQTCSKLYVVFYKGVPSTGGRTSGSAGTGDPRPLLLCYRGCWYRPKDKNGYFSAWVKVDLGDKGACQCNGGGASGTECKTHQALLKALTTTVGFLNEVNLFQHPKGTAGGEGAQTQCQPGEPGAAGATATCEPASTSGQTTCQSETSTTGANTCKYEVHQFRGSKIQVQVTCENVNGTQTPGSGCYRKLTHRPAGLGNGSGDASSSANNGFRLGDVVYCSSSGSTVPQGSIKYYGNGSDSLDNGDHTSTHKWSPLLQVTAYFYKHDTGYCDPLLVELQFAKVAANGVPNGDNDNKEYYRLKTRNGSGGKLVWERDTDCAKDLVAKPECLTRYLDAIRYCLKKVVRIQLEKNKAESYDLVGKDATNGGGKFEKINNGPPSNGKQIQVQECKCPALTAYKCYRHCLTEALAKHHHLVAGLVFTLPGQNGDTGADKAVEIPVCVNGGEAECGEGAAKGLCTAAGTQASCSSTTAEPTASTCPAAPASPSVPCKNGQCDGPGLGAGQTCSASPAEPGATGNGTINVANGPKPNGNGHKNLVNENGWNTVVAYYSCSDQCYSLPQLIVLLRTDNPVKNGEAVTGSTSQQKYGYYVLATKNGSTGGGLGGGVSGSTGYAYQWRLVNGKSGETSVKLDEKTDFQLLNAAIILTEWTKDKNGGKYCDEQIKKAVESAKMTSPGHSGDVNRLSGKTITVSEEPGEGAGAGTHQCLKDTGFKAMTHNLDKLVKLNGSFKPPVCEVALITGLKFLIPTGERGKYRRVTLNGDAAGAQNGSVKYHHPGNGNKVCVYFYDKDPRPLLVCYNGWAYRAKDMAAYNEQKWTQCTKLEGADAAKCGCSQQPPPPTGTCDKCPLLKALVGVSDFLNPVNINVVSTCSRPCKYYGVHWFNGRRVRIRVLAQFACGSFCYHRFTHTHAGITGKGDGFRLGNIHYGGVNSKGEGSVQGENDSCIKLNGAGGGGANNKCISASDVNDSKNHKASPEVVVFYYKGDKNHEHPLLVALRNPAWCFYYNTYFELTKKSEPRETKLYKKNDGKDPLDLSDTKPGGELAKKLDTILYTISKKLQIVLSTRPVATEYKTGQNGLITDVFDTGTGDKSSNQKAAKQLFDVKTRILNEVAKEADELEKTSKTTATTALTAGKPLATRDALMHHVTLKTTYQAKLCDNNGKPSSPPEPATPSGSGPNHITVNVNEVQCAKLYEKGGYRCFKHDLVSANNIESVGGLVLCVFAGQTGADAGPKSGNAGCQPCPDGGGPGAGKDGLELCTGQATSDGETGCKNGKNGCKTGQSVQLSYTTCKGNLYVFFYGEDPRPLMLCYDKHAYRPKDMETYCRQWVRVSNGPGGAGPTNCRCDEKGQQTGRKGEPKFNTPALLPELYRVSVLLNPVYLRLTKDAYGKLDPKHGQADSAGTNGRQQPSSASGTNGQTGSAASADYTYLTHNYPPDPVRVRVTTQDLQCYRRYTHKPEHEGFRLGRVTYAQPPCPEGPGAGQGNGPGVPVAASSNGQCPAQPAPTTTTTTTQAFCFKYASEKQLQTVCTYYYMYDCAHYWPLVVELGFKGRPSEWWRLCSGPQEGGGNVANTGGSGNGGGGSGNGAGGSNGASGVPTTGNGGTADPAPSKPPAQLKWVPMAGAGKGDSCSDAQSPQNGAAKPAATQPGSNGENCTECPPPATGTGGPQPAHNGNGNHATTNNNNHAQTATHTHTTDQTSQEQREKREQTCARDAAFARDAREIENKLGKTVLGIPAYPRNYPGLEIDLRELIERRAYEIRKSLGIEYGPKTESRLIMETDSNCQEESIMAYLVGGGVFGAAGGSGWKLVTMVTGMTVAL